MTTVQITLPDQLALEAQRAGLLHSETIERILRVQLKNQQVDELFQAVQQMTTTDALIAMSPEEISEEIRTMRAERRAKNIN